MNVVRATLPLLLACVLAPASAWAGDWFAVNCGLDGVEGSPVVLTFDVSSKPGHALASDIGGDRTQFWRQERVTKFAITAGQLDLVIANRDGAPAITLAATATDPISGSGDSLADIRRRAERDDQRRSGDILASGEATDILGVEYVGRLDRENEDDTVVDVQVVSCTASAGRTR